MARQLDSYSLCMYRNRSFQHDLPRPSEVIIPHASSSISLGSKLNFRAETRYQENPSRKSVLRHGFMWDGSIIDVSSSGKLVKEYVDDGRHEDAVQVYVKMLECGIPVEEFRFFPMLIKAFGAISDIEKVRQIHGHLLKLGALDDIYVLNSLLGVYWKCGVAEDAIQLFEKICTKDLVSWNTMISGFCHSGDYMGSLRIFSQMIRQHGVFPNRVACLSALSSCASIESLIHGREIHAFVVKNNFGDEFLFSALIDMYMKCGDVKNAEFIFGGILNDDSIKGNTVVWNVMISGYVSNGYLSQAVELFQEMLAIQILPDFSTMIAVSGDSSHNQSEEIYAAIDSLTTQIAKAGCI
ncbi:hypothetical protein FEM48_Zijuj05G0076000 [Ziziphus jujuba var. spinosa]|uniref:Pentatricopeptide repeat-containing protein n=1 Tax=Ziziphus jujuba var. spinosa TaxID=714518 RepID=A0A978VDN5_ZIZJJ|nr:hypothetical protein FEM48_Zijuj05G0076000 [Ziziphus jujuba var. spinosa]